MIQLALDKFQEELSSYIELSSEALGGTVVSVSDEFFAEAFHLLKVEPAPSLKGSFGPNGALYSGWETRRHNPHFDWCIIRLGAPGFLCGFDFDTSHFNGNEAPEVSVEALFSHADDVPTASDSKWKEILHRVPLGPNSRHLFKTFTHSHKKYNYVKLNMYPDGGIARFRVYGLVAPVYPADLSVPVDLAYVFAGGRVVFTSDQHFGIGSNLLLPGRGKDMGDGWETKRSRQKGHKDWVIIRLGQVGLLDNVEIDTNHFKGNYPESCEMHACISTNIVPLAEEEAWIKVLSRQKLGPHRRHFFQLENNDGKYFTHIRVTIFPDGGIKRVRVTGIRTSLQETVYPDGTVLEERIRTVSTSHYSGASHLGQDKHLSNDEIKGSSPSGVKILPGISVTALPLTTEAFAPFGQVLMAWADPTAAPRGVRVTSTANQNTALKYHELSHVESSYPPGSNASANFSIYRSSPAGAKVGERWMVKILERHSCTNQAFIPMGSSGGAREDELPAAGRAYLVIVALNGHDDKPDLGSLRAFVATTAQGIVYNTGVWHHPMITLEKPIDFTCVETQIGNGDLLDCEVVNLMEIPSVFVPSV